MVNGAIGEGVKQTLTDPRVASRPFNQTAVPMSDSSFTLSRRDSALDPRFLLAAFAATICTSAFLLFAVQPMFAKMVLPKLGGSPLVWSFALVFFQLVLLLGYLYAHVLVTRLAQRTALAVHIGVLVFAFALLPIGFPAGWEAVSSGDVIAGLAGVFALGTGFQFFSVSATAPLLQGWFARTGHPQAADPYFLYGASNLGSFAALALYPFLIEPVFPLSSQAKLWAAGFVLLIGLIALCGLTVVPGSAAASVAKAEAEETISWARRLRWMLFSAVPSGLLVAVTAYITTDVVAAPFLWVLPLALYLLTFVIVFARRPLISHNSILWFHACAGAPFAVGLFVSGNAVLMVPLHLAAFFVSAMVCHGELARERPRASHLTEFYLLMSLGGVLGGLFASLVAPVIFDRILEYPILLWTVFLCRSDLRKAIAKAGIRDFAPAALVLGLMAAIAYDYISPLPADSLFLRLLRAGVVIAIFCVRANPIPQAILVALGLTIVIGLGVGQAAVDRSRSLFGVHMVIAEDGGRFHVLSHGTTIHGAQERVDGKGLPEPRSYYYRAGPFASALDALRAKRGALPRVAVIGLGAGALACHRRSGEDWRFFEIDSEVVRIARDPKLFSFLASCAPDAPITLGDGRISLAAETEGSFDAIVVDAFSSDSIPTHLLNVEAFKLYRSKLAEGGAIIFHISNRYMELASVAAAAARHQGEFMLVTSSRPGAWKPDAAKRETVAKIAVIAKAREDLGSLTGNPAWQPFEGPLPQAWSDDYSNVLSSIWRKFRE
jgi:hypothetical protein